MGIRTRLISASFLFTFRKTFICGLLMLATLMGSVQIARSGVFFQKEYYNWDNSLGRIYVGNWDPGYECHYRAPVLPGIYVTDVSANPSDPTGSVRAVY